MDISQKTVGFMIDELITTRIKIYVQNGNCPKPNPLDKRVMDLIEAIDKQSGLRELGEAINGLITADIACFFAQEDLFSADGKGDKTAAGEAAMRTQHLNAERNNWMRTIDATLGLGKYTVTDKTYK